MNRKECERVIFNKMLEIVQARGKPAGIVGLYDSASDIVAEEVIHEE